MKLVMLTAKEARITSEVMEKFYPPPPTLLTLDAAELTALEHSLDHWRLL